MPRDPTTPPKPHVLLVYVDEVHRTRIEVTTPAEDALEATCVHEGTMCPSAVRHLTRSILRAAMRIQGLTWSHDNDDDVKQVISYGFRLRHVFDRNGIAVPRPRKSKKRSA